jgi:hypothetical protein
MLYQGLKDRPWSYDIAHKLSVFITLFRCNNIFMIKLVRWILIKLVLLVVVMAPAWGLSGARLLGMSSSGQTALFNLGIHDAVKDGDYAVIVKEIRDLNSRDLRLIPVARARNIKINPSNSVWILYKKINPELLKKGQEYLILSETQMLSGRRDPRLTRLSVITDKDRTAFETNQALSDDKDRISKLKTQYPEIETLHGKETRMDEDVQLLDVEGWKKFKGSKYRTALYKSPYAKDFKRELRLITFEKMVTAYLQRVNDPTFNYDAFYDEQKKTKFADEFRQRSNFSTEYETFAATQSAQASADAQLHRSLLEKGESWSEDYSDEELKNALGQVSVLQEKDRRAYVLADPKRYSLFLSYGISINDTQTDKDPSYRRDNRFSIDLDFEATPLLKHETLERFTLNATLRSNKTAMDAGNYNADVNETSVSAGLNWYPLYAPHSIEAPAIFLGTYIRSGTASATAPTVNEKANYTVLSLPGFRAGLRYNLKNNIGIRVSLSMETLNLDRYQQSKTGSVLPDQANIAEGKMNIALAYSF